MAVLCWPGTQCAVQTATLNANTTPAAATKLDRIVFVVFLSLFCRTPTAQLLNGINAWHHPLLLAIALLAALWVANVHHFHALCVKMCVADTAYFCHRCSSHFANGV